MFPYDILLNAHLFWFTKAFMIC
uniref:Uncharacterized protein n=1 Tax=Arundo donax TaxID=35708 RepID=A0A0A9EVI5_ARUDO